MWYLKLGNMWYRANNFRNNTQNKHPIAGLWGWDVCSHCDFKVCCYFFLHPSLRCFIQYLFISDHFIRSSNCKRKDNAYVYRNIYTVAMIFNYIQAFMIACFVDTWQHEWLVYCQWRQTGFTAWWHENDISSSTTTPPCCFQGLNSTEWWVVVHAVNTLIPGQKADTFLTFSMFLGNEILVISLKFHFFHRDSVDNVSVLV